MFFTDFDSRAWTSPIRCPPEQSGDTPKSTPWEFWERTQLREGHYGRVMGIFCFVTVFGGDALEILGFWMKLRGEIQGTRGWVKPRCSGNVKLMKCADMQCRG